MSVCKANLLSWQALGAITRGRCRAAFLTRGGVFVVFAAPAAENSRMAEHVYKKIEIVGSSPDGLEEAIHNALSRASKTIRNMRWFEVTETRGYIEEGNIAHWQVTLKIGFTLEE
jgi:flavin-binding protein dodecin